jgi:hypothetical protein
VLNSGCVMLKAMECFSRLRGGFHSSDGFGGGYRSHQLICQERCRVTIICCASTSLSKPTGLEVLDRRSSCWGWFTVIRFANCLALGADAVYIGTAAMIAINCLSIQSMLHGYSHGIATQIPKIMNS